MMHTSKRLENLSVVVRTSQEIWHQTSFQLPERKPAGKYCYLLPLSWVEINSPSPLNHPLQSHFKSHYFSSSQTSLKQRTGEHELSNIDRFNLIN